MHESWEEGEKPTRQSEEMIRYREADQEDYY